MKLNSEFKPVVDLDGFYLVISAQDTLHKSRPHDQTSLGDSEWSLVYFDTVRIELIWYGLLD